VRGGANASECELKTVSGGFTGRGGKRIKKSPAQPYPHHWFIIEVEFSLNTVKFRKNREENGQTRRNGNIKPE